MKSFVPGDVIPPGIALLPKLGKVLSIWFLNIHYCTRKHSSDYLNNQIKDNIWLEIAQQLGYDEDVAHVIYQSRNGARQDC